MELINQGLSSVDFQQLLDQHVNDNLYTDWYWAVSIVNEEYFNCYIQPNLSKFKSLLLTESWDNRLHYTTDEGKENFKYWKKTCGFLIEALADSPCVHLIKARYKFHPKVYLFCSNDESKWTAFISSCNLNEGMNDCIQSTAIVSQDDDVDGSLLKSIKQIFDDIPLSDSIVGNAIARKKAAKQITGTKQSKEELLEEFLPEFNVQISKFISATKQFMTDSYKRSRHYNLFVEFMESGNREDMAAKYNLTPERIRQLVEKGMRGAVNRIKKLDAEDKQFIRDEFNALVSSLPFFELTSQKSTSSTKEVQRRKKYIDLFQKVL